MGSGLCTPKRRKSSNLLSQVHPSSNSIPQVLVSSPGSAESKKLKNSLSHHLINQSDFSSGGMFDKQEEFFS